MSVATAEITATRTALLDGLSRVALVITRSKPTLPVLGCVHIGGTRSGLRLMGTDFDRTVMTTVATENAEEFPARAVPCHRLLAVVSQLPVGPIEIMPWKNGGVRVTAQNARFDVAGLPADEFPMAGADLGKATSLSIAAPAFVRAITRVATHTAEETTSSSVHGIHVSGTRDGALEVLATDGYRLAREHVSRAVGPALDLILPLASVPTIAKLFAHAEQLTVEIQGTHAKVSGVVGADAVVLQTRLLEGPYADVTPVVTREIPHEAVIDRVALLTAVRRVAALSTDSKFLVRLQWSSDHVAVVGRGDDDAGAARDTVPCTLKSDGPIGITFAPRFLVEALTLRTTELVYVGLKDGSSMMTLRDSGATQLQNLVMPRRDSGD